MLKTNDQWVAVADAFTDAAIIGEGWYGALEKLAEATGGAHGQLICIGPEAPQNNIWTVDPDIAQAFFDEGFGEPTRNPRIRAGMAAPVGTVLADADFITPEAAQKDDSYRWGRARGLGYICLTTLMRTGESSLVGLAVNRNSVQGHISSSEKAVFASLAQQVRAAVRTQMLLEGNSAALLMGTMDRLSIAAFACDGRGRVIAVSPPAEALLAQGCFLSLRQGQLAAELAADSSLLKGAILEAAQGQARPCSSRLRSVVVRSVRRAEPVNSILLDVISLPEKPFSFGFAPRVLVVVRGSQGRDEALIVALKLGFELTEGEAQVAIQLARGKRPETIAAERRVSVGTIRAQIRSLYDKMNIHHVGELLARLNPL
ncbi:helix-turn-helix transcriptional regulator [Pseudomonas sp.]|uniref:helix-turn-helix transcriptional regulator n=1 Tax=Pseudomonas sp. TaxID=306 RepID=UPI00272CE04F|nr:LuxR C-terminal-related transcriptional regulator [Pseudomonas sp.]